MSTTLTLTLDDADTARLAAALGNPADLKTAVATYLEQMVTGYETNQAVQQTLSNQAAATPIAIT